MILLVDFDGVVNKADYFSVQYEKDFGISQAEITQFFIKDFAASAKGKARIEDLLPPYLKSWKWDKDVNSFLDYWFSNDVKLDFELLDFLKNHQSEKIKYFLVSQQEKNRKKYIWENCGLHQYFDGFYCTCEIGYLKSEPAFYDYIVRHLKNNRVIQSISEIKFIDDSEEFIEAAEKCQIDSTLFKSNNDFYKIVETVTAL